MLFRSLYDKDPELCFELGYGGGFQIPIDKDGRNDLIEDLQEALVYADSYEREGN